MKSYSTLLLLFVFFGIAKAQFPTDTQYQTIIDQTPALPDLYSSVIDYSVPDPIEITRISAYVPEWDWYPHHEYSKIQPWNADASLYKFYSNAIYDAQSHQLLYEIQDAGSIYPTYWANTNPDLLYGFMLNGDIKTYSVARQEVVLRDHIYFDEANQTNYEYFKMGPGEGNFDKNDRFVAFVAKYGPDMDVIIYDLQQYQVLLKQTFPGAWEDGPDYAPKYVDWVSVSQSGDYVVIMWNHDTCSSDNPFNGHYGVEVYDRADMQFLRRIADYGNHGDLGYAQDGDEVLVQFWGPTGTVNMYYLDREERVVLQTSSDFGGEGHISCRNLNRPGWAYVSQDEPERSGQIVAVKLDDSGLVEHFGHHYGTGATYKKSPMPVPTPNGDKVMFKSDFGDTTDEVVYTFEAKVYEVNSLKDYANVNVKIFPNPAANFIQIYSDNHINEVSIVNQLGQTVQKEFNLDTNTCIINLNTLPKGIYFVNVKTENSVITKKLLKNE